MNHLHSHHHENLKTSKKNYVIQANTYMPKDVVIQANTYMPKDVVIQLTASAIVP
jgi:hypothetical protein